MKNLVVYVHGKGGSAEEAEHYKSLFPRDEVIGFDYRSQTPWGQRKSFSLFSPSREIGVSILPW